MYSSPNIKTGNYMLVKSRRSM